MNRHDGGPAFPCDVFDLDVNGPDQHEGMTLRDYFIAHAPAEPWPEFSPAMPNRPIAPSITPVGNDGEWPTYEECRALINWKDDPIWDADTEYPKFSYWVESWKDFWAASARFEADAALQRRIQWPSYWADTQLKARKA